LGSILYIVVSTDDSSALMRQACFDDIEAVGSIVQFQGKVCVTFARPDVKADGLRTGVSMVRRESELVSMELTLDGRRQLPPTV
jgi:hypothetical protein